LETIEAFYVRRGDKKADRSVLKLRVQNSTFIKFAGNLRNQSLQQLARAFRE